jgi:phenylpropionate dioxygenase-like ring-hydroxylating dioxygenase large terminal subunit
MPATPSRPRLYASADSFLDPVLSSSWLAVATSADVRVGELVPVKVMGVELVVWRDESGEVHAWEDFCIHRGVKLSLGHIDHDCVVCPYHAWHYDASGRCTSIPAHPDLTPPERARTNVLAVAERYGLVWTSLGAPAGDPPPITGWDDEDLYSTRVLCGPYVFEASAQRAIENFIDPSHLGVVHDGLLGNREWVRMRPYEVQETPEGLYAPAIEIDFPVPKEDFAIAPVSFNRRIPNPLTAQVEVLREDMPYTVWITACPVGPRSSVAWIWILTEDGIPAEQHRELEDRILAQDIDIVNSQRPEWLPLDLQAELHVGSDRIGVAYRNWLTKLGVVYGTDAAPSFEDQDS